MNRFSTPSLLPLPLVRRAAVCAAAVALVASSLHAEHTQKWTAKSEADFKKGDTKNLVLTTQGQLRLSRELKTLIADDPQLDAVLAMTEGPDGTLYVGGVGGAKARVLAVREGKSRIVSELAEGDLITAMCLDASGHLLVATSGEQAKVIRIATDKPADPAPASTNPATLPTTGPIGADVVFSEEGVQYIWDLAYASDGTLYLATGPEGKLFALKGDGKPEVVFKSESDNLTCLVIAKDGRVYLGSDPKGRVYRFDPKTKEAFVLFNAEEPEITALSFDAAGNLYVATGATGVNAPPEGGGGNLNQRGRPDPLSPEKREPDLPEPPMTPPEPAPKKGAGHKEPSKEAEPGASLWRPAAGAGSAAAVNTGAPMVLPSAGAAAHSDAQVPIPNQLLAALSHTPAPASEPADETPTEGSAVYRIDKDGFVSEVFRVPLTIYTMAEHDGVLLLGTGGGGEESAPDKGGDHSGVIYEVDLRRDEVGQIARAPGKDVSHLLTRKDGSIAVGISNGGAVESLSAGLASEGSYTSEVLDATAVARLGTLRLEGSLPAGSALSVSTRSGNTSEPSDEGWTKWTAEAPATHFLKITSPAARYFQYRLTFKPSEGNLPLTASVREAEATYQLPNVAPKIKSLSVSSDASTDDPHTPASSASKTVTWEADDANTDTLEYTLQYRPVDKEGDQDWRVLKEKLTETTFTWNTRTVPDGRYELRVVASDAKDNPPGSEKTAARVSDIVLVDNTPPTISTPATQPKAGGATLSFTVRDAAGSIAGVWYRLDADETWIAATAVDRMLDSPSEDITVTLSSLTPGKHYVYLKATDEHGNPAFATVPLDIPQ